LLEKAAQAKALPENGKTISGNFGWILQKGMVDALGLEPRTR